MDSQNECVTIGLNVYTQGSVILLATIISGSGSSWILSSSIGTYLTQQFNLIQPYTFTNIGSIPTNTVITSGSGLVWTLNQSLTIPSMALQFYNPTAYIQPTKAQINNLTINNGLTLSSGKLSIPNGSITNLMLETPFSIPSSLPSTSFSGTLTAVMVSHYQQEH